MQMDKRKEDSFRCVTAPYAMSKMTAVPVSRAIDGARPDDLRCCQECDLVGAEVSPSPIDKCKRAPDTANQPTFGI